jgi:hypothetical protein
LVRASDYFFSNLLEEKGAVMMARSGGRRAVACLQLLNSALDFEAAWQAWP